ncbi:unnamed protein product [Adineta steineri]|uniref:Uncharacterized protein n=1 Tax=Adineta steineri TaxID=433720 RepID=A0A814LCP5_9BILA|nr:unnamed protein product [Adineta steineri]CAF4058840.1 unnamed protein product [Adineta steineri]
MKFQVLYDNGIISLRPDGVQLLMALRDKFNEIIAIIVKLNNLDRMPVGPSVIDTVINNVDSMLFRPSLKCILRIKLRIELDNCQRLIHQIIGSYLTPKSHARIGFIFNFISSDEFLTYIFNFKSTGNHAIIKEITDDLRVFMRDVEIID